MSVPASAPVAAARGRRSARPSGDDRELAILATAERLLAERPLSAISVDDLARGAGISRPTFYFYFASKDAVLLTLLDRVVAEADAATLDAPPPRRRAPRGVAAGDHHVLRDLPGPPGAQPGLGRGALDERRGPRALGTGVPRLGRAVRRRHHGRAGARGGAPGTAGARPRRPAHL